MGAKGVKVQGIASEFYVQIKFPDRDAQEEYLSHQEEVQQPNGDVEDCEQVRMCDVIRITGKQKNCEAAKRALLDLVPISVEVDVPFDFHRSVIGQTDTDVRKFMERYDVKILDTIKISGTPACVEQTKQLWRNGAKSWKLRSRTAF
jgi:catalase (peroxidase I)